MMCGAGDGREVEFASLVRVAAIPSVSLFGGSNESPSPPVAEPCRFKEPGATRARERLPSVPKLA